MYEQWMNADVRSVKISNEEIRNAYKRFRLKKPVEYWTFSKNVNAKKTYKNIKAGEPVEQNSLT